MATYLFTKRGIYYFERRVPKDIRVHYNASKIIKSLRTKNRTTALALSAQYARQLDGYWTSLRHSAFAEQFCSQSKLMPSTLSVSRRADIRMSDALQLYLALKAKTKDKRFTAYANRAVGYLFTAVSDKNLSDYTRADANAFRDFLIKRGLVNTSVKRNFEVVRAIFNLAEREHALDIKNPFANILLINIKAGTVRPPLKPEEVVRLQMLCRKYDDEMRWLIALLSDTGIRLSEACGLLISDINLTADIPFISIQPHQWRSLKTVSSKRTVPLVGASLWSAQRIVSNASGEFAFPRYCSFVGHKADSASNALNKWMRPHVQKGGVIHSFRHSLRDRLREVECPSDVIDRIGGWQSTGVGQSYGQGYSIKVMHKWLSKVTSEKNGPETHLQSGLGQ